MAIPPQSPPFQSSIDNDQQSRGYYTGEAPPPPAPPGFQSQQPDTVFQKPSNLSNIPPLLDPVQMSSPAESPPGTTNTDMFNNNTGGNMIYENHMVNNSGIDSTNEDSYAAFATPDSSVSKTARALNLRYQIFLDKISPHWKGRWIFSLVALGLFMTRVIVSQGWYVICYALAIYYLNLLIGFISPKVDPSLYANEDEEDSGPMLPTHANDEFRPFIRRVPEFKFWISGTKATLIALFLTMFSIFDVPVFWPILLIYFIILFACTMRQQIRHMIRYSYVPWDSGKKRYTGQSEASSSLYPTTV